MRRAIRIATVGGLALGVSSVACASRGNSAPYELAPAPVIEPTTGGCGPARWPQALPAASMLVDSTRLISRLRQVAGEPRDITVSIVFPGDGVPTRTSVRQSTLPEGDIERLHSAIDSLLVTPDAAPSPWGVRLTMTTGVGSTMQVSRAEYCPPVAEAAEIRSETRTVQVSPADVARMEADAREFQQRWRRMQEYVGRAWVSPAGRVRAVELVRSSGNVEADREAERMLRRNRFNAATLDGIDVYGWWSGNPVPDLPTE